MTTRVLSAALALCLVACDGPECPDGTLSGPGLCKVPEAGKAAAGSAAPRGGSFSWPRFGDGGAGGAARDSGSSSPTSRHDAGQVSGELDAGPVPMISTCGNGLLDPGEACDFDCPIACESENKCLVGRLEGSADECSAACKFDRVTVCASGDGCCPDGCTSADDTDCSPTCGNGIVEALETCDGDCPSCDDGDACTVDTRTGSADQCSLACMHEPARASRTNDGCCPMGATAATDVDCEPRCGDGVVSAAETCDGQCPTSCDDGNPCTADSRTGSSSTCDVTCSHAPMAAGSSCGSGMRCDDSGMCRAPMCGDGVVDNGERCDGNCPTSCEAATEACRVNELRGSNCSRRCEMVDAPMGTVCGSDARGACTTGGDCMNNNWYRPCLTDEGCFGSLHCLDGQCKMECESDSECGAPASGARGKCIDGYCERRCTGDSGCADGQMCIIPPSTSSGVCRPKRCTLAAECPDNMSCWLIEGTDGMRQCLPRI